MTLAADSASADDTPRLYALVPSAGVGARSGAEGPKQYRMLGARSVLGHTLAALTSVARLRLVLVVVSPGDTQFATHVAASDDRVAVAHCGGATRARSVRNGLDALLERGARRDDWVLVHDAARCLVRPEWVDALIDACIADPVGGLLALPVADTLKAERDGRVESTLTRDAKWQAQTPQMFRIGMLMDALDRAGDAVTDEAGAIEALGHAPKLVAASLENFKVTYPADFALAERLLRSRL
ncbi:MAG TPA: 2-C-methyl-D-erythritol 4-phosphate cytidylyltransferase [Burkholderiaceae bacterium]|nr:2-C-methyl-D-erythritol 4-phosphate cytidylyltransferase [Burkholderiaceae bacterium]